MESNRTNFDFLNEIKSPFRARVVRKDEKDIWIIACGDLEVLPCEFETKEQAESFIEQKFLKGYEYMAMAAFVVKIIENYKLLKGEEE